MAGLKDYEYDNLPAPNWFRVIELYAGNDQDAIVCEIHTRKHEDNHEQANRGGAALSNVSTIGEENGGQISSSSARPNGDKQTDTQGLPTQSHSDAPSYEALSYTWEGDNRTIQVTSRGNRRKFTIQSNLESALRQLRQNNQSRFLWVDSICINQENNFEKNHQVRDMAVTYSNAKNVLIWLGPAAQSSDIAFDHMKNILDLEKIDDLTQQEDPAVLDRLAAFFSLIRRRWFSRRWVVQEVALAKGAFLHCGSRSTSWADFADAVQLFASSAKEIDQLFKSSKKYNWTSNFLGDVSSLGAVRLVKMQVLRSFTTDRTPERLLTLEELVSTLTVFEALDPKDTVYAVVALAKDANARPLNHDVHSEPKRPSSPLKRPHRTDSDSLKANVHQKRHQSTLFPNSTHAIFSEPTVASPLSQSPEYSADIVYSAPTKLTLNTGPQPMVTPTIKVRTDSASSYFSIPDSSRVKVQDIAQRMKDKLSKTRLEISYQKSVFEVFKDFLRLAFHTSGTDHSPLDIICRPWAPALNGKDAEEELPSWIRSVRGAAFGAVKLSTSGRIYQRRNADPLVGSPGTTRRLYTASKSVARVPKFGEDPKSKVLSVSGFIYDTVTIDPSYFCYSSGGNIPLSWINFAGWDGTSNNLPEEFWRTLVAERDVHGERVPSLYKRAFQYLYTRAEDHYADLLPRNCLNGNPPKIVVELVERLEAVIWGRGLMRTKNKHRLGLGPQNMREGDLVCILFGCSVPVLLREFKKDDETFYHFLGECFVHGIMDGEALDLPGNQRTETIFKML